METSELLQLILDASGEKDGRKTLDCAQAFKLAKQHKVSLKDISQVCNDNKIKFVNCQLDCF